MRRTAFVLAAAIAALAVSPASAASPQFDLICTGQLQDPATDAQRGPWAERFSVDLASASYCRPGCTTPQDIGRIGAGVLELDAREATSILVNRYTGEIVELVQPSGLMAKGHCQVAPFTPFPKGLF